MAWQATNAAGERLGLTIFEAGLSGGPGMAECPAQASYSVVGATPNAVNAANVTRGLTLTGAAQDASRVTVTLNDRDAADAAGHGQRDPDSRRRCAVLLGETSPAHRLRVYPTGS